MLTSKQRAELKSLANHFEPIQQIGKAGLNEELIKNIDAALEARELIKLRVLETAPDTPAETAEALALSTRSNVVQVIGRCIILYRRSKKKIIGI